MTMKKLSIVTLLLTITVTITMTSPASAYEFIPNDGIQAEATVSHPVYEIETEFGTIKYKAMYTSVDDPINHIVPNGDPADGVAFLQLNWPTGTAICSGALLEETRLHVLTAAHCVTDANGNFFLQGGSQATFEGDSGDEVIGINDAWTVVHPNWLGASQILCGWDIAILELDAAPSADITGYFPDNNPADDFGLLPGPTPVTIQDKFGYGNFGTGLTGDIQPLDGQKRTGNNNYETTSDLWQFVTGDGFCNPASFSAGNVLNYDFDDGTPARDIHSFLGLAHLGLGFNEVSAANGDSGGPSFTSIPNEITGVTSYGVSFGSGFFDINDEVDSTFGEIAGDTRVSSYIDFINSVLATKMMGEIHVLKFNDLSADGVQDPGEDPIEGWEIWLDCVDADGNVLSEHADTDPTGMVWFVDIPAPNSCLVSEELKDGWTPTRPTSVQVDLNPGDNIDVVFGNVQTIEAEKTWTHTDYNWDPVVNPDGTTRPANINNNGQEDPQDPPNLLPDDDVLADELPFVNGKYEVSANIHPKNDKFQNTQPGAFYALTTVDVLADINQLTVWEDYGDVAGDCTDNLLKLLAPNAKPERAVKVAIAAINGDVTELTDSLYDGVGGSIVADDDSAHVELDMNLAAGSTVYVLVKFKNDLKGDLFPNGIMEMCHNEEKVDATIGQLPPASVTAEADLRIQS